MTRFDPALPQNITSELNDITRRLTALERSPQLKSASILGGRLRVLDDNSNEIATVGEFDDTSELGMRVITPSGDVIFQVTEDEGFAIPRLMAPWREGPNAPAVSTTSASYIKAWESTHPVIVAVAVRSTFVVSLDSAADVARVKVVAATEETDEVTLDGSVATQWTVTLNWLHDLTLGTGPVAFEIQAKRHSGTGGNINIFEPETGLQILGTSTSATSGGLTAA